MPRLQTSRRTPLLSTGLRNVFLEGELICWARAIVQAAHADPTAFTRNIPSSGELASPTLTEVARRVQSDIRRATGHYCPLHQIMSSIHGIKATHKGEHDMMGTMFTFSCSRAESPDVGEETLAVPDTVCIVVSSASDNTPSMSRRRLQGSMPALQCHLSIPPPAFTAVSPAAETPSSLTPTGTGAFPMFRLLRRSSSSSSSPITPIDQILHTPPSPPRLPRLVPPPPHTWARKNVQARKGEVSPLESPTLPLTPYVLNSTNSGKPLLGRLQIPGALGNGSPEMRDWTPSPQTLSPFDRISMSGRSPTTCLEANVRPVRVRTNSSSNLTRTALLRAARPGLARSYSSGRPDEYGGSSERVSSPLSPFAGQTLAPQGQPLASPLIIRSEAMDGGYFSRA